MEKEYYSNKGTIEKIKPIKKSIEGDKEKSPEQSLETLAENIFHLKFEERNQLAKTFLRFQEYFESPEFRGKIFTLEEYKQWYISHSPQGEKTGQFTYCQDWAGFNVPSHILEPFYQGKFNPLSDEEKQLLNLFKDKKNEKFYIIGTLRDVGSVVKGKLRHEIAHGLYYTNPEYKREVLKTLDEVGSKAMDKINKYFEKSGGYHPDVWLDEAHAYLIATLDILEENNIDISSLAPISKKLNILFDKYFKPKK